MSTRERQEFLREWPLVTPRPKLSAVKVAEATKTTRQHMWHAGYESGKQSVNVSAWFLAGYLGGVAMACFVIYFGSQLLVGIV